MINDDLLKKFLDGNLGFNDFFMMITDGTKINAEMEGGHAHTELTGNPMGIAMLIAACIHSITHSKRHSVSFERMMKHIEVSYKLLVTIDKLNNTTGHIFESKEMADVIEELIKNPELYKKIKESMDNNEK